jgi:hypothetical protein
MSPSEVLVFNRHGSDESRPKWAAHCALDDPETPPGSMPRSSFDVPALVFP